MRLKRNRINVISLYTFVIVMYMLFIVGGILIVKFNDIFSIYSSPKNSFPG